MPIRRVKLFLCLLLFSVLFNPRASAGPRDFSSNPKGTVPKEIFNIPGAEPIGNDACFNCHPQGEKEKYITPEFWHQGVMGKLDGLTCETCHGNGSKHAEANNNEFIINPATMKDKWKAELVCKACHRTYEPADLHGGAGVACLECHLMHTGNNPKHLKIQPERDLCYSCHPSVKIQFNLPNHHPVNEGLMTCTDCHNSHFALARDRLKESRDVEACGACHAAERGPFVFSHITFGGCLQCHLPHGASQQRLLAMAQPILCLECHAPTTDHLGSTLPYCTMCHISIHGSNKQRLFMR